MCRYYGRVSFFVDFSFEFRFEISFFVDHDLANEHSTRRWCSFPSNTRPYFTCFDIVELTSHTRQVGVERLLRTLQFSETRLQRLSRSTATTTSTMTTNRPMSTHGLFVFDLLLSLMIDAIGEILFLLNVNVRTRRFIGVVRDR
jgi:hypothetical protein